MDALDARILLALDDDPDATSLALARRLGIARNTLHARVQRLRSSGAMREHSRRVDPRSLGRDLLAFVSIELSQTTGRRAAEALAAFPEVVEIHSTTGDADLLVKVVATDTEDLHRITGLFLTVPEVVRTSTTISLQEDMPLRISALLAELAGPAPGGRPSVPGRGSTSSAGSGSADGRDQ